MTVALYEVAGARRDSDLAEMVMRIGEEDFQTSLLRFLHDRMGAEHCAILRFYDDQPIKVGVASLDGTNAAAQQMDLYLANYWRHDPTLIAAQQRSYRSETELMRLDVSTLPPSGLRDLVYRKRHISERLLLCGTFRGSNVLISILRSEPHGKFSDVEISRLNEVGEMLLTVVGKHADVVSRRHELVAAITSLPLIEDCMAHSPEGLPRREVEVCARILYGISSLGIGLDLGIGEETVKTYRKRAYQRLGIATQRELLVWYINRWSERRNRAH